MTKFAYKSFICLALSISLNSCSTNLNVIEKIPENTTKEVSEKVNESDSLKPPKPSPESFKFTGIIKEENTGKPLEKVEVFISDSTGLTKKIQTDKDGKFEVVFERPSEIAITYSLNGYQSLVNMESVNSNNVIKEVSLKKTYSVEIKA